MQRQIALFSLVFSTIIYATSAAFSFMSTWGFYGSQNTSQTAQGATAIDIAGHSLAILLIVSTIIASWRLFASDKYGLAIIISLFPISLYAFMRFIPLML